MIELRERGGLWEVVRDGEVVGWGETRWSARMDAKAGGIEMVWNWGMGTIPSEAEVDELREELERLERAEREARVELEAAKEDHREAWNAVARVHGDMTVALRVREEARSGRLA